MKLATPLFLNGLWIALLLGAFLYWSLRRRRAMMARFIEQPLLQEIAAHFSIQRLKLKQGLLLLAFIFSIIALCRPQWGFEWQEVKRKGLDILVVIDTSKSMLTQDVKPNRLERTKLAVKDLLRDLKGDRIGLVAFAGDAFLICPLTIDYDGFLLSLNDLSIESVPRGGTNLSRAIDEALKNYEDVPNQHKAVVIITDGDNLEGEPIEMAQKAKDEGVKIYTIGIGTKEGELIQVQNQFGEKEFLKDREGNFVKSRLNEELLQKISLTTGGAYVKASGARFGLDEIYQQELSKLEKRDIEAQMEKKYYERFQIPLGIAFILMVLETCISTRRENF